MKIAIWGYGLPGREMYGFIGHFLRETKVVLIFDRNPEHVDRTGLRESTDVVPAERIREYYDRGEFDAVLIGVYTRRNTAVIKSELEKQNIPFIEREDLYTAFREEAGHVSTEKGPYHLVSRFCDRESEELFFGRLCIALTRDEGPFLQSVWKYSAGKPFIFYELQDAVQKTGVSRMILFGGGEDGRVNRLALRLSDYTAAAYCSPGPDPSADWPDAGPEETVIGPSDLMNPEYEDCLVILSSGKDRQRLHQILEELHFPKERIYDPGSAKRALIAGTRSGQYFDVWQPGEHEVYVDCGTYNGSTLVDFVLWTRRHYDAVYALEPLPEMQEKIEKRRGWESIHDLTVFPFAAGEKKETVPFFRTADPSGSFIIPPEEQEEHSFPIQAAALDDLISGPVTFIKMDIEGSEMAALRGAQRLIRTWRPRLAISIYHKPFDVLEVPDYLLSLVPEYRFRIRHYGAGLFETVLYAEAE